MNDYPMEYYEFFVKFNEGDYYTCHDLLEEMWLTDKDNYFLKGLLQMTVAIYHYEYGNVKGARAMMNAGYRYIQKYRPRYWGIDLEKVNGFIEQCLHIIPQDVDRLPFEEVKTLPALPSLFLYLGDN
jgi:predicted metal-dependent hydrolase